MVNLFHNALYYIPGVPLIVLCVFAISLIVLLFMIGILLLDYLYRPTIEQYPFNIILDRIIPLMVLVLPTIFVVNFIPFSWLYRFLLLIGIHVFLIIPLFYYWGILRHWHVSNNKSTFITLNHPSIYTHVAIAILYPAIWGAYFSLNRYIRLGTTVNLFEMLSEINPDIFAITIIFCLPGNNLWLKMFLWCLKDIRFWLWIELQKLCYVLHLFLLNYNCYFYIIEILHKGAFILGTFITLRADVYPPKHKYNVYRYILRYIYFNPITLIMLLLLIIFVEILLTKGTLYYGLYILFMYPILYFIGYTLNYLYTMDWVNDVCKADYFARNWSNARYPMEFWIFFQDDSLRSGFNWPFSEIELAKINQIAEKYLVKKYSFVPTLPFRVQHRSIFTRIKAAYRTRGIRWVHTERTFHPLTGWFTRQLTERIVLVKHHWSHYPIILKAEKAGFVDSKTYNCYLSFNSTEKNSLREVFEHNLVTNYVPIIRAGALVTSYKKQLMDTKPQAEPDLVVDLSNASFIDKRVHGLDQKSGRSNLGSSLIYSHMDPRVYQNKLKVLQSQLFHRNQNLKNADEIATAISSLGHSCSNLDLHQLVWAKTVHLFPGGFIPPMRIPTNFSLREAHSDFLHALQLAELKVAKISDYLYFKQIRAPINPYTKGVPDDVLDLFNDSYMQQLMQ